MNTVTMNAELHIEPIACSAAVVALLEDAGLPTADLLDPARVQLFALMRGAELLGTVGVELHGAAGLLRSLAVAPPHRGAGHGRALVAHAERWAAAQGVAALYLLTTDAAGFFGRLGYAETARSAVPAAIAATPQFAALCPASAVLLQKRLGV